MSCRVVSCMYSTLGRCYESNQFFALKVFSKHRFKTIGEMMMRMVMNG